MATPYNLIPNAFDLPAWQRPVAVARFVKLFAPLKATGGEDVSLGCARQRCDHCGHRPQMLISLLLIVVIGSAGILELSVRILQLKTLVWPPARPRSRSASLQATGVLPFISVHVATYNEPPGLVIQTLQRLAACRFSDFEVIIIDNNTDDPGLWAPVARAASALGHRFKFYHYDRLAGAKAGALNRALTHTDVRANYIAIVDADYFADPEFLADAMRSLTENGVDYVQFPQAYRGVGRAARGVEQELGDYFTCFSRGAGRPGSMLPTGTLSLFTEAALRSVGGWPTETITEDAELGVRLQAAGFRGLWVVRVREGVASCPWILRACANSAPAGLRATFRCSNDCRGSIGWI